ncbi:MAG: monofunctional biosynthetic peptidoglycan transglycosylase [Steroidobacteraceae bacterium]
MAKRRGLLSRIFRGVLWLVGGWLVLTVGAVLLLRWVDPPTSAFMLRDRSLAWWQDDKSFQFQHAWVDWKDISSQAKLAVIASEDQKFAEHFGFDLDSISAALEDRRKGGRTRGASTLSQQVAKNLFLWPGQSWVRKGLEAWFTLLIETCWTKQRILEVYLNVAEFGKGVYGVGAASDAFFHKPAARLSAPDAALLAAVLPSPKRFRVTSPSTYVRKRQQWIMGQMRAITKDPAVDALI